MIPLQNFAHWLDVRPQEIRTVLLSFCGAFIIIGFLILARSLREALYLTSFDVKTLPYITVTVAILGLPTVGLFTQLLARYNTRVVLKGVVVVLALGLALLWPLINQSRFAVVAFYLWTALGTLLMTSGFWVATSEYFPLRSAKRLYGLISAGGTSGAMVIGTSLSWVTSQIKIIWLVPGLIGMLMIFFLIQVLLPALERTKEAKVDEGRGKTSIREGLGLVWQTPHLRLIAMVVATATLATTLLDYQFKEIVSGTLQTKETLTSFFGAFYGWTGFASLLVQLLIAARLLTATGVGVTIAVLPSLLLLGSAGFILIPTLLVATLVRGADNSLRKSLHRAVLEVLYVPIPSSLRRKTKTFIDSVVDSMAEGFGAVIIFLWVTLANFPSRFLSVFIIALAVYFLSLSGRIKKQYLTTLKERLEEGDEQAADRFEQRFEGRDLLSGTFTFIDLRKHLKDLDLDLPKQQTEKTTQDEIIQNPLSTLELIQSTNTTIVASALKESEDWNETHIPHLILLLAKDPIYDLACCVLWGMGKTSLPFLVEAMADEKTDFVVRRRIPHVLAKINETTADETLLIGLTMGRFEVRYRSAIALMHRRKASLKLSSGDWKTVVWKSIRFEVNREKAVWEFQRLLDNELGDQDTDNFVKQHVGIRGELSLEHTFRLFALVLDPNHVRTTFHGIILNDEKLKSFALEYLEHVLPTDIRDRLWPFIGDISEYQRAKSVRPLDAVVFDLMTSGATLFADEESKKALKRALESKDSKEE